MHDVPREVEPGLPVSLAAVRALFDLPPDVDVDEHHGGASGAWRLTSAAGGASWSLKVLPRDAADHQRTTLREGAELERRALAAGLGIARPVFPSGSTGDLVADLDGALLVLHEWVDGLPAGQDVDLPELGRWIGEQAAWLHRLWPARRDREDELAQAYGVHARDDWQGWFNQAEDAGLEWTALAPVALPAILEATALCRAALRLTDLDRCVSHRDINPANVIVGQDGPRLIDFTYAGIEVPWLEVVDAAHAFDQPDAITLDAYLRAGGTRGPMVSEALARDSGGTLNYLAFSMWVSLGHRPVSEETREEATERIPDLVASLVRSVETVDALRARLFGT